MAVQPIPDEHHVVRHCKKRETIREKGAVTGVYPQAFLLRPAKPPIRLEPETYLSCNYYEHFIGAAAAMMKSCWDTMIRLNVGRIKSCFKKYSVGVRVTHEPKRNNPSYAAIRPGKIDDPIAGVLATVAVVELVGVGEILRT
jgi:hypothetical protein